MATTKTTKTTKPKPPPNRKAGSQFSVRLSDEERADLDAVVAAWEATAYPAKGITDWIRYMVRREKAALDAKPKGKA